MKTFRQKFYVARELRLSIALIVLWSLLAVLFFAWLAREIHDYLQLSESGLTWGLLGVVVVVLGYGIIVMVLSTMFSHRFIGPFERLKIELRRILAGDAERRLRIRRGDDVYITSFIAEVNRLLDDYEQLTQMRDRAERALDRACLDRLTALETGDLSPEAQRASLMQLHRELKSLLAAPALNTAPLPKALGGRTAVPPG